MNMKTKSNVLPVVAPVVACDAFTHDDIANAIDARAHDDANASHDAHDDAHDIATLHDAHAHDDLMRVVCDDVRAFDDAFASITTTRDDDAHATSPDIDLHDVVAINVALTKSQRATLRRAFAQHGLSHEHRSSWRNVSIPRAIASRIGIV